MRSSLPSLIRVVFAACLFLSQTDVSFVFYIRLPGSLPLPGNLDLSIKRSSMYRYRILAIAVSFVFMISLGCEDNPLGSGGSGSAFSITVGSGTTPTYTWSAGNAFSVSVVRTSTPTNIVWGISSPGMALVTSPATHGTVPSLGGGLIATAATEQVLTAGVQYRVSISLLNGDTGFSEFTP